MRPVVILVAPQMGENIGAAARAMLNCGLDELRLVRPRDGWPNPKALAMATGAASVVEQAQLFDTTRDAISDLQRVYATTARSREMLKPVLTARQAARECVAGGPTSGRVGFLFGPERTGLDNDDVSLASAILHVPLNPDFSSLNLGQAVLLVCFEWFQAQLDESVDPVADSSLTRPVSISEPARQGELANFFAHLEQELDASGFLRMAEKRDIMVRNLRAIFHRADLESHEVRTLHGVVSYLVGHRKDGTPVGKRPRNMDGSAAKSLAVEDGEDPELDGHQPRETLS